MDAAIADTFNRRDARYMARYMDFVQAGMRSVGGVGITDWWAGGFADDILTNNDAGRLAIGILAHASADNYREVMYFDGAPADNDWDALISHFGAEIEKRRNLNVTPNSHPGISMPAEVRVV